MVSETASFLLFAELLFGLGVLDVMAVNSLEK
jgi:hypothetical protein